MDTKIQPVISSPKRGPYRRHTVEFKRAVVARSLAIGTSVSRVAREYNVNANQVFAWRKQFGEVPHNVAADGACQLLPITVTESAPLSCDSAESAMPAAGVIVLNVGRVQLRLEGSVDATTLAQVLGRLLP
ncbi:transposase [Collimonas sp. OK607]|uniref:IS66-like element accessory protein TnpA n=1 Tax=Collimonas sp. OK607 TaxID=1798194 RepID=UPI0008EF98CC|nr:transposase [Collimonas sp. OK607]SFB03832.1 transposase [Collimonas sp. OK607]SFB24648.1 transposase [Collimonas sp. OK607]